MSDAKELTLLEEIIFWQDYIKQWQSKDPRALPARAWDALEIAHLRLIAYMAQKKVETECSNDDQTH